MSRVLTIGRLRELIADLPDDMPFMHSDGYTCGHGFYELAWIEKEAGVLKYRPLDTDLPLVSVFALEGKGDKYRE